MSNLVGSIPRGPRRAGISLVEVLVVLVLVGFFLVWVLVSLPRGRETARETSCHRNLAQIGVGLQLYHQAQLMWPTVGPLGGTPGPSPVGMMLLGLALPDLVGLSDPTQPVRRGQPPPSGATVAGLICPSDPSIRDQVHPGAISYRAMTGVTADGRGGVFEPGRRRTSPEVEAADGLAYTASFAERMVGNGKDLPGLMNYERIVGPVADDGTAVSSNPARWRGDAGSSWFEASWQSTLVNGVLAPNAGPSRIAEDGRTAALGPSSGHPERVNVLYLDGSVRGVTPRVDIQVWRSATTVGSPPPL